MFVYADNAATTAMSDAAVAAMLPCLQGVYGNASSLHTVGQLAKEKLEEAREEIARCIGASAREIYFTSGGSESDNQAIRSAAYAGAAKGKKHIISTNFEHHAVLHTLKALRSEGFEVTCLPVDAEGLITPQAVQAAIRPDTALVTIMYANNEVGTILPIREIGAVCRANNVIFHTDAVQAVGHIPVDVQADNVDMLSLSAHKFHGPKGVGALYCRRNIPLRTFIQGGAQERGKRAGTENVAGIVGLGEAIRIAVEEMPETAKKVSAMRDRLIDGILEKVPMCRLNGPRHDRLPGNCNISFLGIEGESLLLRLDLAGIAASSGSACASSSLDPSHVLLAIGLPHEVAHGSVRLSLSDFNTEEDVDYILEKLPQIVSTLRSMSPLWEEIQKGEVAFTL